MNCPLVLAIAGGREEPVGARASWGMAIVFSSMGKRVLFVDAFGKGAYSCAPTTELIQGPPPFPQFLRVDFRPPLSPEAKLSIISRIESANELVDIVIIDTGLDAEPEGLFLNGMAHQLLVSPTPEARSIDDALGFISAMHQGYRENSFKVLVNGAASEGEGLEAFAEISSGAERWPAVAMDYLGCATYRENAGGEAAGGPSGPISPGCSLGTLPRIAEGLMGTTQECLKGGMQLFWREMIDGVDHGNDQRR